MKIPKIGVFRVAATLGALAAATYFAFTSSEISFVSHLAPRAMLLSLCFLTIGAIFAGLRLTAIARCYGYSLSLGTALRANAAGAAFSQFIIAYVGHTSGRAVVLRSAGVRYDDIVEFGLLERLAALLTLGGAAVVAAFTLFGKGMLGTSSQWAIALYYLSGLLVSTISVAWIWRKELAVFMHRGNAVAFLQAVAVAAGWSFFVHAGTLVAFISLIVGIGEMFPSTEVAAASLLIMFAAAIPISFGGWGIRELSAIAVLGFLNISATQALNIGISIGIGSLLVQLGLWLISKTAKAKIQKGYAFSAGKKQKIGISTLLAALASVLIAFQIPVTMSGGATIVSLSDPIALVCLMLFAAKALENRIPPVWSVPSFNVILVLTTSVIIFGTLHYLIATGYSAWGIRNRLFGWIILMGYLSAGAVLVTDLGERGKNKALDSILAVICVVSAIEILRYWLLNFGSTMPLLPKLGVGFLGNSNAFGLFLLAGISIALKTISRYRIQILALSLLFAAVYLTASRSTMACALSITLFVVLTDWKQSRKIATAAAMSFVLIAAPNQLGSIADNATARQIGQPSLIKESSDRERLKTIEQGISLWLKNPVFGTGIGAYYEQTSAEGKPLVVHNVMVWLLAETGLIGLAVFCWAAIAVMFSLWRRHKAGNASSGALLLFLAAVAAMSLAHDMLFQRIIWLILGLAAGTNLAFPNEPRRRPHISTDDPKRPVVAPEEGRRFAAGCQ